MSFDAPVMKSSPTKAPVLEKSVLFEEPQKSDTLTNLTKVTCWKVHYVSACLLYHYSYLLAIAT